MLCCVVFTNFTTRAYLATWEKFARVSRICAIWTPPQVPKTRVLPLHHILFIVVDYCELAVYHGDSFNFSFSDMSQWHNCELWVRSCLGSSLYPGGASTGTFSAVPYTLLLCMPFTAFNKGFVSDSYGIRTHAVAVKVRCATTTPRSIIRDAYSPWDLIYSQIFEIAFSVSLFLLLIYYIIIFYKNQI